MPRPSLAARLRDDRGSAPAEFVMVGALLVALALGVIQFALALYVRNTVQDAAAEGARYAALADRTPADGAERTRELITAALGEGYTRDVTAGYARFAGAPATVVTVRSPLPLVGLFGLPDALEVSGHAAREQLGD